MSNLQMTGQFMNWLAISLLYILNALSVRPLKIRTLLITVAKLLHLGSWNFAHLFLNTMRIKSLNHFSIVWKICIFCQKMSKNCIFHFFRHISKTIQLFQLFSTPIDCTAHFQHKCMVFSLKRFPMLKLREVFKLFF